MLYDYQRGYVYYELKGKENGTTLIFFHGVLMDHRTFDSQVAELEKEYRIIVLDLPNHGRSSHLDSELLYSKTCAEMAVGLLNHLNIDKAIFIGQSLGSFIVSQVATLYPDKVLATVHIGGGGLYPKSSALLKTAIPFVKPLVTLIPDTLMFRTFAKHIALSKETQDYLIETSAKNGRRVVIEMAKSMIKDRIEGVSAPIEQPSLVAYGDHEEWIIKKMNIKFNDTLANSQITIINNAHHIANQDNPESFNKELKRFLRSLEK